MHELSITQGMLDIALDKAREARASRITAINLVIGEISNIVDDCIQFYFNFLSRDSIARDAKLSFTRIPMQVRCRSCRSCGFSFAPEKPAWSCPQCRKWDAEIVAGQELYIDSIEVE
ncbi:hydrogenase maturation nickel metallochaperone HypA [Chloroflexota bacterium]